ncbi:MAG: enoyl-CoA hydratase/isomerase family protein [Azospirillaceae bacterium]
MTEDVLFEKRGRLGLITLNRPKALNALNLPMIEAMAPQLAAWADDDGVAAVAIRGAGEKAFCAGGDVRAVWEAGMARKRGEPAGTLTADFFREEYRLNHLIHTYPKPYVALVDGISMGGGMGLSMHGSHRVVSERLMFAMPETGIGLFPDVGAGWFLPRCPGQLGTYFALTGNRGDAADAMAIGYGTHLVPADRLEAVIAGLAEGGDADSVLADEAVEAGPSAVAAERDLIDRCFGHDSVEAVIAALAAEPGDFARAARETLATRSPTSMKVTLVELRRGATMSYPQAVTMEFRLSQACMDGHDFFEGIRALLVDKDRNPRWDPPTLDGVDEALIERHFAEPEAGDLVVG